MKKSKYTVKINAQNASSHRFIISIECLEGSFPSSLAFPVWTPGSYLVREYARHVTKLKGGEKINKNTWAIASTVKKVEYEVYAFEKTVRTSFLDENYASIVGATLLPLLKGSFTVQFEFPKNWDFIAGELVFKKFAPGKWITQIENDDEWIDSPIAAARPGFYGYGSFQSRGK